MALSARKKWGVAAIITGGVFVAAGIIVLATAITPAWVAIGLLVLDGILTALGVNLLAKPEIPA